MNEDKEFQKHNSPKACKFCGRGSTFAPLEEMEEHGVHVYFCHPCKAEYLYYWDDTLASTSLYVEIGSKTYRWTVSHDEITGALWHVKTPGVPGRRRNVDLIIIKSFDTRKGEVVHVLTPETVTDKIKTWLLFL